MKTFLRYFSTFSVTLFISVNCFADGNGGLGVIYDLIKCGLNYKASSQRLGQRFSPAGVPQPASFVISGIPACASIERAYLWSEGSGNGAAETATIAGPSGTQNYPMSIVGQGPDKCWSYSGSYTYRADVTSIVTGNGTYNISGILTNPPNTSNDMDGATLVVIYSDPTASYQGRMVIADGAAVVAGGTFNYNLPFSAVCGTTQNASAFAGIGDLQMSPTSCTLNGTSVGVTWNWWNYIQTNTTVAAAQTSANFNFVSSGDCYNYTFAGLYYQTTSCAVCSPPALTLTTGSTPATCAACNGTASVTATTAFGPNTFTYSWAPSGGTNATASGLCSGTYTVTVSNGCLTNTATVVVGSTGGLTLSGSQTNASCNGQCDGSATVTVTSGTGPFTYSWAPSGGSNPTATGLCAGNYTCTVTDANNCSSTINFNITQPAPLTASMSAVSSSVCYGQGTTINFTGTPNATVTYNSGGPNQTITLNGSGNASINTGALFGNVTYTLVSIQLGPCTAPGNIGITITVNPLPVFNAGMPSNSSPICAGSPLSFSVSTTPPGTSYIWTGPAFVTPNLTQNPSFASAPLAAAGVYTVTATTAGGCSVTGTTTVVIYPIPSINIAAFSNPTSCGGNQGAIIIGGLTPNSNYTLYYSTPTALSLPILSNGGGQYILTGLTAGTYTNIYVSQNGCSSNIVGPVTLTDPAPPFISGTSSTSPASCGGNQGSVSLTGLLPNTTYIVNYFDGITTHTVSILSGGSGVITISNLSAGTYSNINVVLNNCTSNTVGPVTVTDPPPPVIAGSSASMPTACGGAQGSISLTGLLPNTTYTVNYFDGVTTHTLNNVSDAAGVVIITGLTAGVYSNVTVTLNSCTSAIAGPFTLTDPSAPVVTAASNTPVCEGQAINFTATVMVNGNPTAPNSISWTGPAFITPNLSQNPVVNNAVPSYSGVYTVVATVAGCNSIPVTTNVNVYPAPAVPVTSTNSPVCSGNDILLNVDPIAGAADYHWTGPNGLDVHQQNVVINNAQSGNAGTYDLAVTTVNNCTLLSPANISVVVNPTPGTPAVTDMVYCQQDAALALTATPSGNPNDTLKWYTQATGGTGTTAPTPSTTTAGTFVWYVSQVTAANCEGARVPQTVYVKSKPAVPFAISNLHYCQGDTALSPLTATGDSLKWYTIPVGGTPSFTAPVPSADTPGVYTWYVSQTKNGCESDRLPIIVTVNTKPAPPVTTTVTYCRGDVSLPLTAIGQNLLWYTSPLGGTPLSMAPVPLTDTPGTTTWYVSQSILGCESNLAAIDVHVLFRPTADIISSRDEVCQNDTLVFNYVGNSLPSTTYNWTWPIGSNVISGNGQGPYVVHFNNIGTFDVTLVATDSTCASPIAHDTITVKQTPVVSIDLRNSLVCTGDPQYIEITGLDMEIHNYLWDFGVAHSSSGASLEYGPGPYYLSWDNPGHYTVSLEVTAKNQCWSKATDTVMVHEHPEAKINASSTGELCNGEDVILAASINNPKYTYSWKPQQFFDFDYNSPVVTVHADRSQYVTLKVTNEYGCESMDSVMLNTKPCCELYLPSAFSPNGDGKNDLFRILNPGRHKLETLKVFNRFGEEVFETSNELNGWDGSHNGVAQEMGVYFYILKYDCDGKNTLLKGEVTLVR